MCYFYRTVDVEWSLTMTKIAAHPGLYNLDDERPLLKGGRCCACDTVFFPNYGIGCEVCGAADEHLVDVDVPTRGRIHTVATAWIHDESIAMHGPYPIKPPFTVVEIALDAGPFIRALMAENHGLDAIGRTVEARWTIAHIDAAGDEIVEPRFVCI